MIIADIHFSRLDFRMHISSYYEIMISCFKLNCDPGGDYSDCYMLVFSVGRII